MQKERLDQMRRSLLSSVRSEQAKCALANTGIEQQRRQTTVLAQKLKQCSVHLKSALDDNEELKGVLVDLHEEQNQTLTENKQLIDTMLKKDAELFKLRSFQHVALRESQMARGILKPQTKDNCSATNNGGRLEKGDNMEARVFGMDSSSPAMSGVRAHVNCVNDTWPLKPSAVPHFDYTKGTHEDVVESL